MSTYAQIFLLLFFTTSVFFPASLLADPLECTGIALTDLDTVQSYSKLSNEKGKEFADQKKADLTRLSQSISNCGSLIGSTPASSQACVGHDTQACWRDIGQVARRSQNIMVHIKNLADLSNSANGNVPSDIAAAMSKTPCGDRLTALQQCEREFLQDNKRVFDLEVAQLETTSVPPSEVREGCTTKVATAEPADEAQVQDFQKWFEASFQIILACEGQLKKIQATQLGTLDYHVALAEQRRRWLGVNEKLRNFRDRFSANDRAYLYEGYQSALSAHNPKSLANATSGIVANTDQGNVQAKPNAQTDS